MNNKILKQYQNAINFCFGTENPVIVSNLQRKGHFFDLYDQKRNMCIKIITDVNSGWADEYKNLTMEDDCLFLLDLEDCHPAKVGSQIWAMTLPPEVNALLRTLMIAVRHGRQLLYPADLREGISIWEPLPEFNEPSDTCDTDESEPTECSTSGGTGSPLDSFTREQAIAFLKAVK